MTALHPSPAGVAPGPAAAAPLVRIRGLHKRFGRADRSVITAIDGVDLDVAPDEFLVLLGPCGCGKTTLLRSIAGLETPDRGRIEIGGATVFDAERRLDVAPERRGLSMMFQSYALWPHMTVSANVAYPLEHSRNGREDQRSIATKVRAALELVGVSELAGQYPGEMSGGQQQRVALARALVAGDPLVLFDEPLSNVDAKVRERLRVELLAMQRRLGFAAVYVTHDQTEAMELASRIAVIRQGRIVQLDTPRRIHEQPASRYVAHFVGIADEMPGTVVVVDGDRVVLDTPGAQVVGVASAGAPLVVGQRVVAIWRPEHGRLSTCDPGGQNAWPASRHVDMFAGPHTSTTWRPRGAPCGCGRSVPPCRTGPVCGPASTRSTCVSWPTMACPWPPPTPTQSSPDVARSGICKVNACPRHRPRPTPVRWTCRACRLAAARSTSC